MKLLASDYDGTLNRNRSIIKEDIEAIERWRADGNLFGLVTGRGFPGADHEMKHYGIDYDFLICNNGSAIYKSNGKLYDEITGDNVVLKPLIRCIMDYKGERAAISGGRDRVCVKLDYIFNRNENENFIDFDEIDSIRFSFTQVDTNAITDSNAEKLAAEINRDFGDYVYAHQNGTNVDITPAGVSKPGGIYRLMKLFGISKKDTFVVGDNFNDLEMIREFDGFAVSSGNPAVVSQASRVYDTIAELIEDIL